MILDRTVYVDKAKAMLADRDSYENVDKNPVPQVESGAKRALLSATRDKLPEKTVKKLTPGHSRTPVFYGLPKDHKPSVPLRPVISACGGPTEKNVVFPRENPKTTAEICSYSSVGYPIFFTKSVITFTTGRDTAGHDFLQY